MSIKATTRVWENSNQRGSDLLLLLALGDRSDDEGISWPGIAELSSKTRVDQRQVKRMLKNLEAVGELYVLRGTGRGHANRYFITSGLDAARIESILLKRLKLLPLIAAEAAVDLVRRQAVERVTSAPPFIGKDEAADSVKRVSRRPPFVDGEKGDIPRQERVTFAGERVTSEALKGDILGQKNAASPDAATLPSLIRHEPSHEPPCEPSHTQRVRENGDHRSGFDWATCERFAEQLPGIVNPGGYAKTIWRSGEDDHLIDAWLTNGFNGSEPRGWRDFRRQEMSAIVRDLPADDPRRPLVEWALTKIDGSFEDFKDVREQLLDAGLQLS